LFGKKGKSLFNKNEDAFIPYNYHVFKELVQGLKLPTIMNFYEKKIHLIQKRKFESLLNSNNLAGMFETIEEDTINLWLHIYNSSEEICLFDEITQYIIQVQAKYFFNYIPSSKVLSQLAYFEDYFTLGLHINPITKLKKYFEFVEFVESKNMFVETYDNIRSKSSSNCSLSFKINLEEEFLSEVNIYNQFYNFITAGSANISKSFIYLLCLIKENNYSGKITKKFSSINEIYSIAGKLLNEYYRIIPFIENQVVGPYVYRICDRDFLINEINEIKKGDEIYFYNTLENVDANIYDKPFVFNPFRENLLVKGKSSNTFGAGVHRCSGALLADLWLHHLLVGYLKSGITLNSEMGLQHTTYNPDFVEIKKVSYLVLPHGKLKM
jgi:cytochrome P450